MVILGIDPGLGRVGYGVVEKARSRVEARAYGCITTNSAHSNETRLAEIYKELVGLIKRYRPNVLACEKLFYFKNQKTIIQVSQARGVILLACEHLNVPLVEPTPLQVKSSLTSWGLSPKKQVQSMVKKLFNLREAPKPDDAADALAIAYSGATLYRNTKLQAPNHKQYPVTKILNSKQKI